MGSCVGTALCMLGALGILWATPVRAQTQLIVRGTLIIDGDGTDTGYTPKYTGVTVEAGTETRVIRLSPQHPTLVIRGNKAFGDSCTIGAECYATDLCEDGVCGWTGIEVAQGCGDPAALAALDATLDDCVRAWGVPNPPNIVTRANVCMRAGNKLWGSGSVVDNACPQLEDYRRGYDLLFTSRTDRGSVLNKAIQQGVRTTLTSTMNDTSADATRVAEIEGVLAVIDSWFRAQVTRYGTAFEPSLVSWTSRVTGLFFKSVFTDEVVNGQPPPISATDAATIAERIQKSGFHADKQVLRAAFSPGMPLQTAPLLLITSDALAGLSDRTVSFSRVQDIACRFRSCEAGRTSVGNYMKLLGSLATESDLEHAISLAKTNPRTGEPDTRAMEWTPVFQAMKDRHVALRNAVLSATDVALLPPEDPDRVYRTDPLLAVPLDQIPEYAVPLANIVRPALAMSDAFESTGTFRPRPRALVVGMDADRNNRIRAEVDRLCAEPNGAIPTAIRDYQANERGYITSALEVAQQGSAIEKAERQLQELKDRYLELSADVSGLRGSKHGEELAFGSFMEHFAELAPSIAGQNQQIEVSRLQHDIDISAAHARFNPADGPVTDVLSVAALAGSQPWKVTAEQGEMINFAFTGRWAPTCALRNIDDPSGNKVVVKDATNSDIMTGPEGYSLASSGSLTKAQSESSIEGWEAWYSHRESIQVCAGTPGAVEAVTGVSAKACATDEFGIRLYTSGNETDTETGATMNSFSWSKGIRSRETPFPREAVGSLLLVEMPPGVTDYRRVRSVKVLTYPQASVLVNRQSDYYLVVNDKRCTPVSPSALAVRVTKLRSIADLSTALAKAMGEAQQELRSFGQIYVAQGRLLPGQRDMLRARAIGKVYEKVDEITGEPVTSMSIFAESLRNLFDTFVNKQIADIEREIEMIGIERQMRAILAEEDSIMIDIASRETAGRVDALLGGLSLRNLDLTELSSNTGIVSDLLRDWMEPVINLRMNGTLTFSSADKQLLDRVISLSPGGKYVDNLSVACPAVRLLTTKLTNDSIANPSPALRTVILSIPNPETTETLPQYRTVDPAVARAAWESLRNGGDVSLTVTPSMFYERKEPFALQCSLAAPVVRSMVYYLARPATSEEATFNSGTTVVSPDMVFPRHDELYSYAFENGLYLMPPVTLLSGGVNTRTYLDALIGDGGSYWNWPGAVLPNKGTSPFATYHLDLSSVRNTYTLPDGSLAENYPFKDGVSLLVAFQVEAISQAPNTVLPGVPPCDPN
jgi:hypothetical protein